MLTVTFSVGITLILTELNTFETLQESCLCLQPLFCSFVLTLTIFNIFGLDCWLFWLISSDLILGYEKNTNKKTYNAKE